MSSEEKVELRKPPTWMLGLARLTQFLDSQARPNGIKTWWESISVGESKIEGSADFFVEQGPYKDGQLTLQWQPGRIDWVYTAEQSDDKFFDEIPDNVGSFEEGVNAFNDMVEEILKKRLNSKVTRVAVGAVTVFPVASPADVQPIFAELIPEITLDKNHIRDFIYQVNRSCKSTRLASISLNRLVKWSHWAWGRIRMSGEVDPDSNKIQKKVEERSPERHACRLEIDLNTSQEFKGTFTSEVERDLVKELLLQLKKFPMRGFPQ